MNQVKEDLKPIDCPDDVTPGRLRRVAKDAEYSGRPALAVVFEHAAARIEQLEKRVRSAQVRASRR